MGRLVWQGILAVTLGLLTAKISIVLIDKFSPSQLINLIAFVCLLYLLFLSEGIHTAANRLCEADRIKVHEFIIRSFPGTQQKRLNRILPKVFSNGELIAIGRQILIVVIVASLTSSVDYMEAPDDNAVARVLLNYHLSHETAHFITHFFLNSLVVNIIVSALLPCWFAQILPEMIASKASVDFLARTPFAKLWTFAMIAIAKLGVGSPGVQIYLLVRHSLDIQADQIEIGDYTLFERAAASFGYHIRRRKITIQSSVEKFKVRDEFEIVYTSGNHTDISNGISVFLPHSRTIVLTNCGGKVSENIMHSKWLPQALKVNTSLPDDGNSEEEWIYHIATTLETSVPLQREDDNVFEIFFEYEADPLNYSDEYFAPFTFEIAKPTAELIVELKTQPGTFIVEPAVQMQPVEDLRNIAQKSSKRIAKGDNCLVFRKDGCLIIKLNYPAQASRYIIDLDARFSDDQSHNGECIEQLAAQS